MTNGLFGAKGQNNDWFVFENALGKDAKRIVACVNACAEFDDPEFIIRIMKGIRVAEGGLPDLKDALSLMEKLKAERDELLAALKFCRSVIHNSGMFERSEQIAVDQADAAIAKIEGGQS